MIFLATWSCEDIEHHIVEEGGMVKRENFDSVCIAGKSCELIFLFTSVEYEILLICFSVLFTIFFVLMFLLVVVIISSWLLIKGTSNVRISSIYNFARLYFFQFQQNHRHVLPMLVCLGGTTIFGIFKVLSLDFTGVVGTICEGYSFICVYSLYEKFREQNESARNFNQVPIEKA